MPISVEVKLGEVTYTVPRMNIGQLKRTTKLSAQFADQDALSKMDTGIAILAIALERARPAVPNIDDLEVEIEEIGGAVIAILGMNRRPKTPGEENPPASTLQSPGGTIGMTSTDA